ncbi:MAG TPA: hypothetical protein VF719_02930, partial [Abditibacteriaceae bacterium]
PSTPSAARAGARPAAASKPDSYLELPASFIQRAADAAATDEFDAIRAAADFTAAFTPPVAGAEAPTEPEAAAGLAMARSELAGLSRALQAAAREAEAGDATDSARALLLLLRSRLALQANDLTTADTWFEKAQELAPDAAETLVLSGVLSAAESEDRRRSSATRAELLNDAANVWEDALEAETLAGPNVPAGDAEVQPNNANLDASLGGVARSLLTLWVREAGFAARLVQVEPPLVTPVGNEVSSMLVRHYADDPSLRLALPSAERLAQSATLFGLRADDEELVLFPTPEIYAAYRGAVGGPRPNAPAPGNIFGDVVGSRMLMVSQSTQFIILPPAVPGGPPRRMPFGVGVPAAMGRLHAQILINQVAGGGTQVPAWIENGMAALGNRYIVNEGEGAAGDVNLRPFAAAGGLLSAAQFEAVRGAGDTSGLADTQSLHMMAFFYERFGAGAVVETLQRLGAGATVDEALAATIELSEAEFFKAWYDAEFTP